MRINANHRREEVQISATEAAKTFGQMVIACEQIVRRTSSDAAASQWPK